MNANILTSLDQRQCSDILAVGNQVATEVACGTWQDDWFNFNGSTIIRGVVVEIAGDRIAMEVVDPSPHQTLLEVGQVHRTLVDQCWRVK
jgi:hypothetical protein